MNPDTYINAALVFNPELAIGYGLYLAVSGYDPIHNRQLSDGERWLNGGLAAFGVFGKVLSFAGEAMAAGETLEGAGATGIRGVEGEAGAAARLGSEARAAWNYQARLQRIFGPRF